jgi:hypothetical protein
MAIRHTQEVGSSRKNLMDVQFIDIQWLNMYGLRRDNALEYFYTSPFFDISSNNQIIRIQGVDMSQHDSILQGMIGTEYVLDDINTSEPNLFVVREQHRRSRRYGDVDLINVFYILNGIVFQCPDFLDLLKSRISKTANYLAHSFETAKNSVAWHVSFTDDGYNQTAPGLRLWTPEVDSDTENQNVDKSLDHVQRKYLTIIREFPSFKTPLLDAFESVFELGDV